MTPQKSKVTVQEVGLRDGLQSVPHVMPTSAKKRWIDAEYAAGVRHMEVASFVPARLLPQMADADEVIAHALTYPDLTVTALVPNLKGAEKALASGVHRIVAPVSVSAAHSTANVRKTPVEMVGEFGRITALRDASGKSATLIAGLSTVFGCTYQGKVPLEDVRDIVLRVLDAGCDIVALADTTGHATPGQVGTFLEALMPVANGKLSVAHFHDTRGLALANTIVAARSHVAADTLERLTPIVGCWPDNGPAGEPDQRRFIERFFQLIAQHFAHHFPGTTGSDPKAIEKLLSDPGSNLSLLVELAELEEMIEVLLADYNGEPHDGIGGRTPLEAMAYHVDRQRGFIRTLPSMMRANLYLLQEARTVPIRDTMKKRSGNGWTAWRSRKEKMRFTKR